MLFMAVILVNQFVFLEISMPIKRINKRCEVMLMMGDRIVGARKMFFHGKVTKILDLLLIYAI